MELRTRREWMTAGGVKEFFFFWLSNDSDNDNDTDNDKVMCCVKVL